MMKAWIVSDNSGECGSIIVFAETRGKAKHYALRQDEFDGCEYTDLWARRFKDFDNKYHGHAEADWYDPETRITLVRDYGWTCIDYECYYCENCPAKQWCHTYNEYQFQSRIVGISQRFSQGGRRLFQNTFNTNIKIVNPLEEDVKIIKKVLCVMIGGIKRNGDYGYISWDDAEMLKQFAAKWKEGE